MKSYKFSIFGYYGQSNTGDEAILASLLHGIHNTFKKCEICVYSSNPKQTILEHKVNSLIPPVFGATNILIAIIGRNRKNAFRSWLSFLRSNIVIIGGGGLFYDNLETNKWMLGYIKLIKISKLFRKKIIIAGISVGPLHHQDSKEKIGKYFNYSNLIIVRDHSSYELLLNCGVHKKQLHIAPDLVFSLPTPSNSAIINACEIESIKKPGDKKILILTPCSYNADLELWKSQYIDLCNYAIEVLNFEIWLLPMQQSSDKKTILELHSKIRKKNHARALNNSPDPMHALSIIRLADIVIAERLHGSIMALVAEIPFLSITYMPKVTALLEYIGRDDLAITMETFLSGKYYDKLNAFIDHLLEEKKSIATISKRVKRDTNLIFEKISEELNDN